MKKTVCFALALLIALSAVLLTGCKNKEKENSEAESATVSAAPTAEPTPTPTPAPETDEPAPTPAPEIGIGHQSMLPAPEVGSDDFMQEFMTNPIDLKYEEDMNYAASGAAMVDACTEASNSWIAQIDAVYMQILDTADEETAEKVKKEQEAWVNNKNDSLQEIRNAVSEDDAMASVTVAENIMLYYRTRAIDLCAVLYEIDGVVVFG